GPGSSAARAPVGGRVRRPFCSRADTDLRSAWLCRAMRRLALPSECGALLRRVERGKKARTMIESPRAAGFGQPGEWSPHRACWLAWPSEPALWPNLELAQASHALLCKAIA